MVLALSAPLVLAADGQLPVRELAGPVPPWYPDARPVAGPIRGVGRFVWQAADLLARFGDDLMMTGAGLPWGFLLGGAGGAR